ncbi:MAG: DegT/DnrJ/EryC1/StrS family aminotransferase [Gracilimonas sp.]|uniref:DegT/DnrJ/EryC1/StrS family aminotransferase n=1 Tax=Gracilimonas sp. TaxID=1974203 RepID=UPI001990DFC9|nr:DegT/DnrJ/EryC1/StrS family aminotransferase [Gracilimonas sp.]MBD3616872.1 DegT/DnrJ/EryC1/StrS family aminotransferase [Gracilimonas sp.]
MIQITKPFMPPLEEYQEFLEGVWEREYLTNDGPLVRQLEKELTDYLKVSNLLFLSNGTIALQIAMKALGLKDEIITTPFSYVATTSSIVWEGCKPVFVDIDQETLNINPDLIEGAITEKTTGILATHVYGNPCDIESIKKIADKHGLKIIYDAAHCFGTTYKGKSVFEYGDISASSFHATKLFHTVEGGAVFTQDDDLNKKMWHMRNFGHAGPENFEGIGINGKNSELHAAMGLVNLRHIDRVMEKRKKQSLFYSDHLGKSKKLKLQQPNRFAKVNYAYFPVVFDSEELTLQVFNSLVENKIYPRRYFYPSLNKLDYVTGSMPISENIASRVLCLPLYHDLTKENQDNIVNIVIEKLGS